jgi:hypothetical protein
MKREGFRTIFGCTRFEYRQARKYFRVIEILYCDMLNPLLGNDCGISKYTTNGTR